MGIIKIIQASINYDLEKEYASIRHNAELLEKTASICLCGGMAPLINTKAYTYKCIQCDKKFDNLFNTSLTGFSHLLDTNYYDEAIDILKKENRILWKYK